MELIDNQPIREAVLEAINAGYSWRNIAARTGVTTFVHERSTATRIQRALGVYPESKVGGRKPTNKRMKYETAVAVIRAIDRDPVEFGL